MTEIKEKWPLSENMSETLRKYCILSLNGAFGRNNKGRGNTGKCKEKDFTITMIKSFLKLYLIKAILEVEKA